jgi:hypothetical protein
VGTRLLAALPKRDGDALPLRTDLHVGDVVAAGRERRAAGRHPEVARLLCAGLCLLAIPRWEPVAMFAYGLIVPGVR